MRKASPTARFLATYSPELNVSSAASDPPKKEGLFKATYGPINIGQISMKRATLNHLGKAIFLFESSRIIPQVEFLQQAECPYTL